jgi:hypothetical protein
MVIAHNQMVVIQCGGKANKAGFKSKELLPSCLGFLQCNAMQVVLIARRQGQDSHTDRVL